MRLDQLRRAYDDVGLEPEALGDDPLLALGAWLADARAAGMVEPNAMALATADSEGRVSARMVLLKGLTERGAVFYSNHGSRKGLDLTANPRAALTFWWDVLERQVRVEGVAEPVDAATSDAYFHSRPYGSQLAAAASEQSRPLADREELEARVGALRARYPEGGAPIPRPEAWGGFLVVPDRMEFWKGRRDRMHDRIEFRRDGDAWLVQRLYP